MNSRMYLFTLYLDDILSAGFEHKHKNHKT